MTNLTSVPPRSACVRRFAVPPPLPGSGDGSSIPTGDDYWQWLDAPGNLEKVLAMMEK